MSQMGMSAKQYSGMDRQMSMDRHMDMDRQMSGMRMGDRQMSMYNNDQTNKQGMDRQMSMYNNDQAFGVDQYYNRDDFGNYAYGYVNGNNLNRRVEYIADDQGFRIIKEDGERFKRE